jgi:hypothetical protein
VQEAKHLARNLLSATDQQETNLSATAPAA